MERTRPALSADCGHSLGDIVTKPFYSCARNVPNCSANWRPCHVSGPKRIKRRPVELALETSACGGLNLVDCASSMQGADHIDAPIRERPFDGVPVVINDNDGRILEDHIAMEDPVLSWDYLLGLVIDDGGRK